MKVEIEIPSDTIANLMVSLIENGYSPWIVRIEVHGESLDVVTQGPWYSDPKFYDQPDFKFQVVENEDDDEDAWIAVHEVDRAKMIEGLQKLAKDKDHCHHLADMIGWNEDATTADIFMQFILFGEEKYA